MSHEAPATRRSVRNTLAGRALWDNRRVLTAWILATALLGTAYASFYPQVSGRPAPSIPDAMKGFNLDDISSAAGYLQGSVFGLLLPLLATFYGAATGARVVSADEESGYLDLLLAHPVSRIRLLLHRFAALAIGAFAIAGAVLLAMLAIRSGADLDAVPPGHFAAQCLNLALLATASGALAAGIGAAVNRSRGWVFGVTAGVGVLGYALNGLLAQTGASWLRHLTPFHYYLDGEPLRHGLRPGNTAVLLAVSLVLVAAGAWRLERRDLAT